MTLFNSLTFSIDFSDSMDVTRCGTISFILANRCIYLSLVPFSNFPISFFSWTYPSFLFPELDQNNSLKWCNEPELFQEMTIVNFGHLTERYLYPFSWYRNISATASNSIRTIPIFAPTFPILVAA